MGENKKENKKAREMKGELSIKGEEVCKKREILR